MSKRKTKHTKPDARERAEAIEELAKLGREIAARVKNMKKYEEQAEEKAGFEIKKAMDERQAIEHKMIPEARVKCKAAGKPFREFQAEYFPDMGRTKLYKVLAIADGRTTEEKEREKERNKKRAQRAQAKAVSGTSPVPDTAQPASTGNDVDPTASAEEMGARFEAMEQAASEPATPQPEVPSLTREEISDDALAAFKKAVWELCPKMLPADRKRARVFLSTETDKLDNKELNEAA